jgi:hypothetical protein
MSRTNPLISAEEMRCLLAITPTVSGADDHPLGHSLPHWGASLWLVKGIFLYVLLMNPAAANWVSSSSYLWLRGGIESVFLAVFWVAALHPRGRTLACASMLVASTTLLMDALTWIAMSA